MAVAASSVRDAVAAAVDALTAVGCETPRLDAELLVADAMGVDRTALLADPDAGVPPAAARRAGEYVRRRLRREPVAYILGRKGFRWIELAVDGRVLIPRPETELLVDVAVELPTGTWVHDVGTGSGAVALAVKHERADLVVTGSDSSPGAVEVARANADRLGLDVRFELAPLLPPGPVPDLVVANLPYVAEDEASELAPEIAVHEPREAIVAGPDGLEAIRALAAAVPGGSRLALEHAPAQAGAVRLLLDEAVTHRDLAGQERVTVGRAP